MAEEVKKQEIKVSLPESLRSGVYCNNTMITHTKEEFIMDFMMVAPPAGIITARVIMSPGHLKRTIVALQKNLKIYEGKFGRIKEAAAPQQKNPIGFHTV